MTTTLFRNGSIRTLDGKTVASWVLVGDDTVLALGDGDTDPPQATREVDLDGATLMPAFCDAHVHLPATGLYSMGIDLRGERRSGQILQTLRERSSEDTGVLFGGNFEDPLDAPITASQLDEAVGARPALLARADMHSCIASTALLNELELDDAVGVDRGDDGAPTGYLREQAAGLAWRWFDRHLPEEQQRAAIRRAAELAYAKGIASVHEMFVVEWRGWESLEVFLSTAADLALDVVPYVATDEVERVVELGLPRIGGDYFLDGSFGSHTAWLSRPYEMPPPAGSPPCGISYRSDQEVLDFFTAAHYAGLQTGVHVIGDAAIDQALRAWEEVAELVGIDAVRSLGHRLEHFECASDEHIARAADLGLRASVQPAFDALWGGPDGLYAHRIGDQRASAMNRFKSMNSSGMLVGAGSDSTVTPMDPFLQMAALRRHHLESERVDGLTAARLHTRGSHALAGLGGDRGFIHQGTRADLAMVDRDPVTCDPEELSALEVVGTWIGGRKVWPLEEAE